MSCPQKYKNNSNCLSVTLFVFSVMWNVFSLVSITFCTVAITMIQPRTNVTPGVRRSKRPRINKLPPGGYVQYKEHWGETPSKSNGKIHFINKLIPIAVLTLSECTI